MDLLRRLQEWYKLHCDGDWEHSYGITIDTLDNPGWSIRVDLTDTLLENVDFQKIKHGDPDGKNAFWMDCAKENSQFVACGSVDSLEKLISVFLDWAESNTDTSPWNNDVDEMKSRCCSLNEVESLRELYHEICSLPNEHPRKTELLKAFNAKWNEVNNI